ncbi:DUF3040 domain-containing protein [Dactylosporangium roseum]|uniref:DUF3040 domain-containing protein n=1 Tax=Dactylosporangium roseum TaxID=47989 RepID=A0ABY5YX08_9ACTN|nr:DUF3040 domain-containing protein [Dactylosporangium roseum]UWZ33916.1 DUF3040 domain-containing protein [Dactylosporangium roseum]
MGGPVRPDDQARLAELEQRTRADDPLFAAGLAGLRPCAPREYRRPRFGVAAGVLALVAVLLAWLWFGWIVTLVLTLKVAATAVLLTAKGDPDREASSI